MYITLAPKLKMLLFIKVSFNIRDDTIMIGKMSFNFLSLLIFMTVYPRGIFRDPIKSLWWSFFVKIVKNF